MPFHRISFSNPVAFLTFAFVLGGWAKDPVTTAAAKHSFWQLRSGTNTISLLGSIHFLKADAYPLPKRIEDAFAQAEVVAFETDIGAMKDPQTMAGMLAAGACPEGKQLSDLVSAKLYARFEKVLAEYEMPIELFENMRPWLASLTLTALDVQKQGFDPEFGVDQHFYRQAKADGKRIVALETVEDQTRLFQDLSGSDDAALLAQTLDEMQSFKNLMSQMVTAWKTGDTVTLDTLMHQSMKDQPRLYQRLLIDRNRKWLPTIERLIKEGRPAFVVVGAGHLVGKDSVVDLLRAKGWSVSQK